MVRKPHYLPSARRKLKIDVDQIRAANPNTIYARGSAFGDKGPEREIGGFDNTAFWTRSGVAYAMTPEELGGAFMQPIAAFGDSMGGMDLAGGIAAALLHRERTGEALEVDVSLLSTGWWACGSAIDQAIAVGRVSRAGMPMSGAAAGNPFLGNFGTSDDGTINLCTLTPGPCARDLFNHMGLPELADDPRFDSAENLMANWKEASDFITAAFASNTFEYWRNRLTTYSGQWAPVQSFLDLATDELADVCCLPGVVSGKLFRMDFQRVYELDAAPQWTLMAIYELEGEQPESIIDSIRAASGTEAMPSCDALSKAGMIQAAGHLIASAEHD